MASRIDRDLGGAGRLLEWRRSISSIAIALRNDLPRASGPESARPEPVLITDWKQPYTYDDGLEFRIVKIKTGHFTSKQAKVENKYWSKKVAAPGDGWVTFTLQLKNGSDQLRRGYFQPEVTYGPNSTTPRLGDSGAVKDPENVDVKILPGRQKTGWETYAIPEKYWGDVRLEVERELENPPRG